jgi:hypothetical protein
MRRKNPPASPERASRFPSAGQALEERERLSCFGLFFGESVSDTLGVVLPDESANRCQDCPDMDICFRLIALRSLAQVAETQQKVLDRLDCLESRLR